MKITHVYRVNLFRSVVFNKEMYKHDALVKYGGSIVLFYNSE